MEKIIKVSQFIRMFVIVVAIIHIGIGLFVAINLDTDPSMLAMEEEVSPFELRYDIDSSEAKQLAAIDMNAMIWLESPIYIIYLMIYWFIFRLFSEYREAKIFSVDAILQLRNLGVTFIIWPVFAALYPPLLIISLKALGILEHGEINLGLGADDLSIVIMGLMLTVVGWIMGEAQKIKEEQELTV
jgi:hypothetical protein